jgi:ATP-dependent Lon protease
LKKKNASPKPFLEEEKPALDLSRPLPLLPLRDTLVVPGSSTRILVGRDISIYALTASQEFNDFLVLVMQRESEREEVNAEDLYPVGVLSKVLSVSPLPNGYLKVLVEGVQPVFLSEIFFEKYFTAQVELRPLALGESDTDMERARRSIDLFRRYAEIQSVPADILEALPGMTFAADIYYGIIPFLRLSPVDKQALLAQETLPDLADQTDLLMETALSVEGIAQRVRQDVQQKMQQSQKEWLINEQIRMLQDEVSEGEQASEPVKLAQKIKEKKFSKEIQEKLDEELDRMKLMHPTSPEYAVVRNYIDWFLALPYNEYTETNLNLKAVQAQLDAKHFGLEKVKDRILEYIAVLKMTKSEKKSSILCLVGPPGVGKTTLVASIAEAMERKFIRISLGGVRDEAEIRGHRRTYIGSMPGRFIQALRRVKCMNPVMLLDEIDKMASDFRGDPASAMLEVLDPELNTDFTDHFMEVGFDLSRVLFIATANTESSIPEPLRDRLEIVRLPGYYAHEKMSIAREYLIPKICENSGIVYGKDIEISDACIQKILDEYTREAGVRDLERALESIVRKRVKEIVLSKKRLPVISDKVLTQYLGAPRFLGNRLFKAGRCGLVTGLAWTSVGGEILTIECMLLSGRGQLMMTGKLGDVMKESAQIALSLVRERLQYFGVDPAVVRKTDIHVHVPEGAVPKDGPSAGIALTLALLSAFTKIPVPPDTAFTGEVSLSGDLHAIGGLNEKALAALAAGVKTLILPEDNRKDVAELPGPAQKGLKIILKTHIDEIIKLLFKHSVTPKKKIKK